MMMMMMMIPYTTLSVGFKYVVSVHSKLFLNKMEDILIIKIDVLNVRWPCRQQLQSFQKWSVNKFGAVYVTDNERHLPYGVKRGCEIAKLNGGFWESHR